MACYIIQDPMLRASCFKLQGNSRPLKVPTAAAAAAYRTRSVLSAPTFKAEVTSGSRKHDDDRESAWGADVIQTNKHASVH
jgi:hypothetical protein